MTAHRMLYAGIDIGSLSTDVVLLDGNLAVVGSAITATGASTRKAAREALDAALRQAGVELDAVVLIEVPDSLIIDRIIWRRNDPETGTIYHLKFNPPPAGVADRLVHRKDDTEQACTARLDKYHAETAPIVPFYEAAGILRRVDGVGEPDEVTGRILAALR